MQKTHSTWLFCLLLIPTLSTQAETKASLAQVFNGQMLGVNVHYFESVAGTARETFGEQNNYSVAGCTITATVNRGVIRSLRLELAATCRADLESFIGDYAPPKYRAITFGAFEDLSFYADCLQTCGNARDPVLKAVWHGPRAAGFSKVMLETELVSGPALDAAAQWREEMLQAQGADWVEQARFNCQRDFDASANALFKSITVTAVTIGHDLETPRCW